MERMQDGRTPSDIRARMDLLVKWGSEIKMLLSCKMWGHLQSTNELTPNDVAGSTAPQCSPEHKARAESTQRPLQPQGKHRADLLCLLQPILADWALAQILSGTKICCNKLFTDFQRALFSSEVNQTQKTRFTECKPEAWRGRKQL